MTVAMHTDVLHAILELLQKAVCMHSPSSPSVSGFEAKYQ
jgi:hypothetical protein